MYIIFDMDGVIVDSEYTHALANVNGLKKLGVDITMEYAYSFVGSTLPYMMETIANLPDVSYTKEQLQASVEKEKESLFAQGYPPVEGAVDVIKAFHEKGFPLALASSSAPETIHKVLTYFDVEKYFDVIVSGTTIEHPKPAPDIFLKAVKMLGADTEKTYVIEDSTYGVQAAKAAKLSCIGYQNPHSGNQDLTMADLIIHSMKDALKPFE